MGMVFAVLLMQSMKNTRDEAVNFCVFYNGLHMVVVELPATTNNMIRRKSAKAFRDANRVDWGKDVNAELGRLCAGDNRDESEETLAKKPKTEAD